MKTATHVAIAIPTASPDTAGARAFLQERLALWALWVFVLSGGFFVVNVIAWPFTGNVSQSLLNRANLCHVAASLAFGLDSLVAKKARLSLTGLRVLEAVALVGGRSPAGSDWGNARHWHVRRGARFGKHGAGTRDRRSEHVNAHLLAECRGHAAAAADGRCGR
jgi:hypothetical protein